ncbi:MAG: DNA sulfur modification protein DndD [Caldilinea sp.]|mgnify:CR=1 FL=1|nr:DNA sulfur modification protein DndD [Caldilinea sp.]
MIIHSVTLENYGIYAGIHTFDLTPKGDGPYQQPIILLRGQNGVGKSTLMEAIRLGLHGKLSLGNRVTQREYDYYLERRIHRAGDGQSASFAAVSLAFEHIFLGKRHQYRVRRSWSKPNNRLESDLGLWVDEEWRTEDEEENEHLLRELIAPGIAELFFFDGEKINTLAEAGDGSDALLADTVKNLLGLHLVEQLDRDLDVYLTRQTGIQELQQYQAELGQLSAELAQLEEERAENQALLTQTRRQFHAQQEAITALEQRIAQEGGQYARDEEAYNQRRQQLLDALARNEQEIFELTRGVMPFAVAPNLLRSLRQRLEKEAEYERWQAAQPLVEKLQDRLLREPPAPYVTSQNAGDHVDLVSYVRQVVTEFSRPPIPDAEVVHRVSPETRGVLFSWIDEALTSAPQALAAALATRQQLRQALERVDETLSRVPVAELLRPLQEELRQADRALGRLEAMVAQLSETEKRLAYHWERLAGSRRRVSEQIATINTDEGRIKLAARTQLLLSTYRERLITQKLARFAEQLTRRLNQLNRKRNFIEGVEIDPQSFGVTLYRAGQRFSRSQLSAGEQQIFAIATLWALREVSGRPLPVVIDTPLSRLDDEHRRAMLAEFLPQVAQQVIVLATTTEIDDATLAFLRPALSRAYLLEADSTATQVTEQTLSALPIQIGLEEVASHAV